MDNNDDNMRFAMLNGTTDILTLPTLWHLFNSIAIALPSETRPSQHQSSPKNSVLQIHVRLLINKYTLEKSACLKSQVLIDTVHKSLLALSLNSANLNER